MDLLSGEAVSLVFVKKLASGSFGMVEHQELRRRDNDESRRRRSSSSYTSVAVKSPLGGDGNHLIHNEGEILRVRE